MTTRSIVALLLIATTAHATILTWTGGGGDNNFSTTSNWDTGTAPVDNDDLIFDGSTRLTPNNDLTINTEFDSITFAAGAGAFVVGGIDYHLGGNITNASANSQEIAMKAVLQQDVTIDCDTALEISETMSGAFGVTKTGSATLTLSDFNSFTTYLQIDEGCVQFAGSGGDLDDSCNLTNSSGCTVSWNLTSGYTIRYSLAGDGGWSFGSGDGSDVNYNINPDANTNSISGTLYLTNSNTRVNLSDGAASIGSVSDIYAQDGQLYLSVADTYTQACYIAGTGYPDTDPGPYGAIRINSPTDTVIEVSGPITLTDDATIGTRGRGTNLLSGSISGDYTLSLRPWTTAGAEPITLAPSGNANSFKSMSCDSYGYVKLGNTNALNLQRVYFTESGALLFNSISETIPALYVSGTQQAAGTWGATGSGSANTNDSIFADTGGTFTVVWPRYLKLQ